MRTFIVWMAALSALGSGFAASANAASGAAALDDQVSIAGEARDTPRVTVSGNGVPLRAALRQIVPPAYSINLPNAGAWAATPVTWSAGHSLSQTLRDMLASHPELAAQVDTDFQLVTVRYRPPFGADTLGVASAAPAPAALAAPPASLAVPSLRATASAAAVEVGAPIGGAAANARPLEAGQPAPASSSMAAPRSPQMPASSRDVQAADSGASPIGMAPRLTSQPFASSMVPAMQAVHPPTQAERVNDGAVAAPAVASGSPRGGAANAPHAVAATAPAPNAVQASQSSTAQEPGSARQPVIAQEPAPLQVWSIALSDRTVRGALTRWTQQAGWRLIWEAPVDFAVDAPATLTGTFDEALQSVVGALAGTESPVQAILYRGNKVLRIVEKGAG
jgi:hypothetical protein